MADKVIGGTPRGTESLCNTCRAAHRVVGLNLQTIIFCNQMPPQSRRLIFPVSECSIYDDKRIPSLFDMEQIAWHVTSRNRGAVGFGGASTEEIHLEPPSKDQAAQQPATARPMP